MFLSDRLKNHNRFEKFSRSNGINGLSLDRYKNHVDKLLPGKRGMTPMVIEERQLNASTISVFDRLMMDRIIFLGTDIDEYIANIINAQLLFLDTEDASDEPIWLYINSPGGDCYSGLAIYDTMNIIKSPVHTCVMGLAASMAFVLAIAGRKKHRYALKHSRLMEHQPWGGPGAVQATDLDIYNKEMQELKMDIIEIIAKHTDKDKEIIKADTERDFWFTAQRAIEYGAIDKILNKNK